MMRGCSRSYNTPHRQQRGAVLVVSLIVLLLLTMIGVGGMRTTGMEERMAGNLRDQQIAFQAAETALRHAEAIVSNPLFTGVGVIPELSRSTYAGNTVQGERDLWEKFNWASSATAVPNEHLVTGGVAAAPRFVIEEVIVLTTSGAVDEELSERRVFRITARAVGQTGDSNVVLQSVFKL